MSQDKPNWTIEWRENDSDVTWHVVGTFAAMSETLDVAISLACDNRKQAERLCGALHGVEMTFVNVQASGSRHIRQVDRNYDYYRKREMEHAQQVRDAMDGLLSELQRSTP